MIAVVCVYVGWVRSMCGEVYIAGVPGEVGNRDTFSAVIICIMDFKKKKKNPVCLFIIINLMAFDVACYTLFLN